MDAVIPGIDALYSVAAGILRCVPEGLARGVVSTGLYGLGFLGKWALPRLQQDGVKIVACYDANEALNGTVADGVPVYSAGRLKEAPPEFLVVTARHAIAQVSAMLKPLGIAHVSYDAWQVAANFAAFRRVHDDLLSDVRSKEALRAVMMTMLTGQARYCAFVFEKDQYFSLPKFCGSEKESFVDAGAFVGDTVERFVSAQSGIFSRIYAFEPGRRQFAALQARSERLIREWALQPDSIELINAGLGGNDGYVFATSDSGQLTSLAMFSHGGAGAEAVKVLGLDNFLGGRQVSFLKADVEGMEMALLKGARASIRQLRPKIAICVYHYPTDIPDIANYLAELVPDYRFALRHHSPQLMETVLYCWVD